MEIISLPTTPPVALGDNMPNINLKKLWRRKSVDITEYDPSYKVIYLGNVLTGWAKGDGCVEKPLATLWRNYCQNSRPDISMKVTICGSGLRAVTKEHGLTEYWAHRVTFCAAHPAYPRVFCWVYRHEGRRLKQELRCHAVLCPKQGKAEVMATQLRARLVAALHEFRREKVLRQQARLSVVNAASDTICVPMRKLYLVTGAANYRPPLERSKSAPKLGAIEEEEEDEVAPSLNPTEAALTPTTSRLDSLLHRLREQSPPPGGHNPEEVALVYERVEDCPLVGGVPPLSQESVTYSSPDLLFYPSPHHTPSDSPPHPPSRRGVGPPPLKGSPDSDDLALLESLKDKLGSLSGGGEESLTSDQPESIGSHSCSSSCGDAAPEDEEEDGVILTGDSSKGVLKGEEDNISEESGYSEDKDCLKV